LATGPTITLVLGGARSGKSEVAERLAAHLGGPVTYLATGVVDPLRPDPDFAARIAAHQRRRPSEWRTVEAGAGLVAALARVDGDALVDGLGTWVAASPGFLADAEGLCAALLTRDATTVVVSDEVGLGVHPSTEVGGRFRDALGLVNQAVAAVADTVMLVVAGRILRLDGPEMAEDG
jgi:adenosyl cobinamide kinase/adenosyl cobinamide phosphate guanylyltransferase